MKKVHYVKLPIQLESLDSENRHYLVRVVGLPVGTIERVQIYGWDWSCGMAHVDDEELEALGRAIHALLSTPTQRVNSGVEKGTKSTIDHVLNGKALRSIRLTADFSEEDAAEALGCDVEELAWLEAGKLKLGAKKWEKAFRDLHSALKDWNR